VRVDITLCLVAFLGCGSPKVSPAPADAGSDAGSGTGGSGAVPDYASGSRLRVRHVVGSDGSRAVFGGFEDQQLGLECYFQNLADGGIRCLPVDGLHGHQSEDFVSGTVE
jgi:hypothetical protein